MPAETQFLGMESPPTEIPVRGLPAARNSQPYRNRRACAGNTNCIPICPIQAKYDPTITLNEALNHRHVTMMNHTVASEIVLDGNGRVSEIKYIRYSVDTDINDAAEPASRRLDQGEDLRHRGQRDRNCAPAADVEKRCAAEQDRRQSQRDGRSASDGPSLLCRLGRSRTEQLLPYRGPLITSGIGDLATARSATSAAHSASTSATRAGTSSWPAVPLAPIRM